MSPFSFCTLLGDGEAWYSTTTRKSQIWVIGHCPILTPRIVSRRWRAADSRSQTNILQPLANVPVSLQGCCDVDGA